ncbi:MULTISPECIES: ATP-grasp domain-containing protein [Xenorhabdus]|uniref:ATP-grasp domain-containing protein n=1 Tax=Xenorhabdus TaxID=626 RepID=UPI00064A5D3A|nr:MULTISPECIES: ATP-grasp domain-containing protein [Xenorhabdus]KLU15221.1 hypothetical protein AAY47_12050 [Xenorhabdus griffiniae]KOP31719.1 hypothetical protein AFK69_19395 [Xenorhabdus sp. GDc328]
MNKHEKPILVIVDGYSSGAQLPGLMKQHGWEVVHVSSLQNLPSYYLSAFRKEDYLALVPYQADVAAALKAWQPQAVVPGTESGVILADRLASELGLPGNPVSSSLARRNKYVMHNTIKAAGLRSMDHILSADLDAVLSWARQGEWPVVMKPAASAGTDSVVFCADEQETAQAFSRLHGTVNQMGERNDTVLVQRFLAGQEYFVNGISARGQHIITEVWRTDKIKVAGAAAIYDRSVLLHPYDPQACPVTDYVYQVLEALGIRWGANHTEVMVTRDGPVLIECASRLSGGLNPPAARHATGNSQLDLLQQLICDGESIIEGLQERYRQPPLRNPLWQVQFIAHQSGKVSAVNTEQLMAELQSKVWIQRAPAVGDRVTRTIDLFTSPGIIFMSHPDEALIQHDYEIIRQWEQQNKLFVVQDSDAE